MTDNDALLQVVDLKKHFAITAGFLSRQIGAVKAVDGISFQIQASETLGLVGESGCGKSTAGRAILHLLRPTSGQVFLGNVDLTQASAEELRGLRPKTVSYTHLRAHETPEHLVCRLLLEKKKNKKR